MHRRPLLVTCAAIGFAVTTSGTALSRSSAAGLTSKPPQRVCGLLIARSCPKDLTSAKAAKRASISLTVEPGVLVEVTAEQPDDVAEMLSTGDHLLFRKVCVTGHLVQRQTTTEPARFRLTHPVSVLAEEESVVHDWTTEQLASSCDDAFQYPQLTRQVRPAYTQKAMDAGIQGVVTVQMIVGVDGVVERSRVVRSLDRVYGLDEEALKCANQWRFSPATIDGRPVTSVVMLELAFKLK